MFISILFCLMALVSGQEDARIAFPRVITETPVVIPVVIGADSPSTLSIEVIPGKDYKRLKFFRVFCNKPTATVNSPMTDPSYVGSWSPHNNTKALFPLRRQHLKQGSARFTIIAVYENNMLPVVSEFATIKHLIVR